MVSEYHREHNKWDEIENYKMSHCLVRPGDGVFGEQCIHDVYKKENCGYPYCGIWGKIYYIWPSVKDDEHGKSIEYHQEKPRKQVVVYPGCNMQ